MAKTFFFSRNTCMVMVRPRMRPHALVLLFALIGLNSASWATVGDQTPASQVVFYFHRRVLMMVNANQSVYVYDRADINPPLGDEATVIEFSSGIRQTVEGIPAWVGGVSWGSRTVQNDTRVVGPVAFRCWLSSEDWLWIWELSGVGVGVAEVDNKGQVIWGPIHRYKYAIGNMLGSSPKEIQLSVDVDHVFKAGNHILFGVVAGSTKQGWKARAHFGSTNFASHVVVPFAMPVKSF
jgi:hypothetical protein